MEYGAAELTRATNNYSKRNMLGRGGFGAVYKGRIRDCLDVAIKILTQVTAVALQCMHGIVLLFRKDIKLWKCNLRCLP